MIHYLMRSIHVPPADHSSSLYLPFQQHDVVGERFEQPIYRFAANNGGLRVDDRKCTSKNITQILGFVSSHTNEL